MLAGFDAIGLDTDAILRATGVTRKQIDDPYAGFPDKLFELFWRQAFLQDPRPDLPTRSQGWPCPMVPLACLITSPPLHKQLARPFTPCGSSSG